MAAPFAPRRHDTDHGHAEVAARASTGRGDRRWLRLAGGEEGSAGPSASCSPARRAGNPEHHDTGSWGAQRGLPATSARAAAGDRDGRRPPPGAGGPQCERRGEKRLAIVSCLDRQPPAARSAVPPHQYRLVPPSAHRTGGEPHAGGTPPPLVRGGGRPPPSLTHLICTERQGGAGGSATPPAAPPAPPARPTAGAQPTPPRQVQAVAAGREWVPRHRRGHQNRRGDRLPSAVVGRGGSVRSRHHALGAIVSGSSALRYAGGTRASRHETARPHFRLTSTLSLARTSAGGAPPPSPAHGSTAAVERRAAAAAAAAAERPHRDELLDGSHRQRAHRGPCESSRAPHRRRSRSAGRTNAGAVGGCPRVARRNGLAGSRVTGTCAPRGLTVLYLRGVRRQWWARLVSATVHKGKACPLPRSHCLCVSPRLYWFVFSRGPRARPAGTGQCCTGAHDAHPRSLSPPTPPCPPVPIFPVALTAAATAAAAAAVTRRRFRHGRH